MNPVRQAVLVAGILVLFGWAASGPVLRLMELAGGADWGSDWRWLADGLGRLVAGLPLNHPEYVAGPFSQLDPGPAYTWSLHPPWNASLLAPLLLIPPELRQATWTWMMAASLAMAVWIAWPRGIWWGSTLLIGAVTLGPPAAGLWIGLVDQVHYANPNALVLLGIALAWTGRWSGRTSLIAAGLVLAAVKVAPAVGMTAWLLAARTGQSAIRRGIALAAGIVAGLTVPIVLLDPGVLTDSLAVTANLVPWAGLENLAPQVRLAPLLGIELATWLSWIAALAALAVVLVRRLDGPGGFVVAATAPLLLTPQLWAHWLLIPMLAVVAALGASPAFRRLDLRLRSIATGTEATPGGDPGATGGDPGATGGDPGATGGDPGATGGLGTTRPVRALFAVAGTVFLGLGILGIVLPILPTTPFLLLAAASYARASGRLHAWLLANPRFGPIIRSWQQSRSLPPGVKPRALAVIGISFSISILVVGDPLVRVALAAGGLVLLAFVARLPSRP